MTKKTRVAVVGAGWAGLSATISLLQSGVSVTLIEAGRTAGGRARQLDNNPLLDNGQHILLGAYRNSLAMMATVGLDTDKALERLPFRVESDNFRLALPRLPAPFHLALGLLFAKGASFSEKYRVAKWLQGIQSKNFVLENKDQSVAKWLVDAGKIENLRTHLLAPLCLAALNTDEYEASAQIFANVLRDTLGSSEKGATDILLPRENLSLLFAEPAVRFIVSKGGEFRTRQRVKKLIQIPTGWEVDGENFSHVIWATAPQHARAFFPEFVPDYPYSPIATLYLRFSAGNQPRLPCPLFYLAGDHPAWLVQRSGGWFSVVISGAGKWQNSDEKTLCDYFSKHLSRFQSEPIPPNQSRWIKEKRATFACRPGIYRPEADIGLANVWLAGDYTWSDYPATLEGAVMSGQRAAECAKNVIKS